MPFVAAETAALAERTLGHLDPARVAADPAAASDAARLVELAARDASVRAAVATDPHGFVPALAAVSTLRCVLTLRELPLAEAWPAEAAACRLVRVGETQVSMSWADGVGVTTYCCEERTK